jgi:hypothetical protein
MVFILTRKEHKHYHEGASKGKNAMKNIVDNNLVRFVSITKKKDGMFANFKVKGLKSGTSYNASISIDLSAAEVDPGDSLEKIIEGCARIAVRDLKKSEFQFEGLAAV